MARHLNDDRDEIFMDELTINDYALKNSLLKKQVGHSDISVDDLLIIWMLIEV